MTHSHLNIETDRLLIRPFKLEDIEPSYAMNLDTEVSKYTGDGGVVSKKEIKRRILEDVFSDYETYGYGRLAVELKVENKFIGFTGLKYINELDEVDLGYRFMREYWGQGIATESASACLKLAFEILGLNRVVAMVLPENSASVRVLNKLNFIHEKNTYEDGHLVKLFSLPKARWQHPISH